MSRLVVSEIVSQTCPTSRVQTIEKWTAVADICRCLHNFNGVLQICSAFSNSSVYRLKQTWTRRVTKAVSETETWNHFGISGSYAIIELDIDSSFFSSLCLSFWEQSRIFLRNYSCLLSGHQNLEFIPWFSLENTYYLAYFFCSNVKFLFIKYFRFLDFCSNCWGFPLSFEAFFFKKFLSFKKF